MTRTPIRRHRPPSLSRPRAAPSDTRAVRELLAVNSALVERLSTLSNFGMSFDGKRDIYTAAGYKKALTFDDYYGAYRRQDISRRVVVAPANETWRKPPVVMDGLTTDDGSTDTPFAEAWNELATGGQSVGDKPDAGKGLLHYLNRVDRISGIGRYGVLYLGVRDGKPPAEPLEQSSLSGPDDLLFVGSYHEASAAIANTVAQRDNERFGLPEFYNLSTTSGDGSTTLRAHWTRCIHIAEDLESDDLYGTPRLEACWNRIFDLLKIMAGSGEAAWKLLDTGQILTTRQGAKLPTKASELTDLEDQIDEFVHGLRRWLLAEGLESTGIEGTVEDPTGLVNINVALISAATGIPQRVLLGSERGELASSQDEQNWANIIATRQENYVSPMILRPVINRLCWAGVLPRPTTGIAIWWPPLADSRRDENATAAQRAAVALRAQNIEADPADFVNTYLPELSADKVVRATPAAPPVTDAQPAANRRGGDGAGDRAPFWRDYP